MIKSRYTCFLLKPWAYAGTTAKLLAQRLGFGYIDSGAMYRAVRQRHLER